VYQTQRSALNAVSQLNKSIIHGNSRYIDVKIHEGNSMPLGKGGSIGAAGRDSSGMVEDPMGSGRVLVRGFDFGTTDEQLGAHMSTAGVVYKVQWVDEGSAVVVYQTQRSAMNAVSRLHKSIMHGNRRYIDVLKNEEGSSIGKGGSGGTSGKRGNYKDVDLVGSGNVLVRGFDFGTTDEQLGAHMSSAGEVYSVQFLDKGSALVVYQTPEDAANAVSQLNHTTIDGNSRYIDVILKNQEGSSTGKGGSAGASGKNSAHTDDDPVGSGRVLVRGFDFGTTDEQLEAHMSSAGAVHKVHFLDKGSAVVVYHSQEDAMNAISQLNHTTVDGNSRYIDVISKSTHL